MQVGFTMGGVAVREPGLSKEAPWTPRRLQRLTGGTVLRTATTSVTASLGDRHVDVEGLLVDGRQPATQGMASLTSGRWPRSTGEVVVTAEGVAAGLPTSGTLTLAPDGANEVTVSVVGLGTGWETESAHAELVALPSAARAWHTQADRMPALLVSRQEPVTWADVKRLNAHGLIVESRQVFEHPQQARQTPEYESFSDNGDAQAAGIVALLGVGILIETMLMAGPAFAVSASRQRRSLALIASNGGRRAQIRRYVLAQAVLLGVLAAAVGAVVGVISGIVAMRWWASTDYAVNAPGPVDIPVWEVLGAAGCAAGASLVAAYLPARGAGRLDLVGVLRGHSITTRPVRAGMPLLGAVLAGIGGFVLVMNIANHGHEVGIAIGTLVLFAGVLLLIPWLLSMVGRLGRRLPLSLRMATRDVGRQRGRSAPAVAAIMAAVTALTALAIANASDQEQSRRDYEPQATMGQGLLSGGGTGWPGEALAVVHREAPGLEVMPNRRVGISTWIDPETADGTGAGAPRTATVVRVQRSRCTGTSLPSHGPKALVVDGFGPVGKCSSLGSDLYSPRAPLGVIDPDTARARLGLTPGQADVLADGGMLVASGRHAVHDGRATVLTGTRKVDNYGDPLGRLRPRGLHHLPAVEVDAALMDKFGGVDAIGALVTTATAAAQHWPTFTAEVVLRDPSGAISKDTEQAISQRLSDDANLYVERGFQSDLWILFLVLFGIFGLLVLVATLISTALAQAEGRADLGTLAAVGATKRLRRGIAGGQAFVVALVGTLLGVAAGFVPGIAATWPLTVDGTSAYVDESGQMLRQASPVIDIPWLALAAVAIGVPVLAALLAAAAIRKSPQVTHRAT